MEISSITGLASTGGSSTKALGEGGNVDAFSELFAMLFGNMLMPANNPYSLLVNQANLNASSGTLKNNVNETQALSILEYLRTGLGQFESSEGEKSISGLNSILGSMLGNNADLQKLFSADGSVSPELKEFINSIKGMGDGAAADIMVKDAVKTNKVAAEVKAEPLSDLFAVKHENSMVSEELREVPVGLDLDTAVEAKKIPSIEKPDSQSEDNLIKPEGAEETKKENTNRAINTQEPLKAMKPEEKTDTTLEPDNSIKSIGDLNNFNGRDINKITPEPKAEKAVIVKNPQDLVDIAVERFKTLKLPGFTEVTVKLKPEDLGEISLKLVLEKGQINGSITTDRKEVAAMLQNNLDNLKSDLKDNNVNLNHLSVNIQSGEDFSRNNNQRGFARNSNRNSNKVVQAFEEEIQATDPMDGLNIIA